MPTGNTGALGAAIAAASAGRDLSAADAEAAFGCIMDGQASAVHIAALLVALRTKGEAPGEVAGGVRALRRALVPVRASAGAPLVDTCGTGGGRLTTFNISTAAALVAAGAGARIAKHGNRSFTSKCGSADVLEALGVKIDLTPAAMADVLDATGIVFMFAPLLHPAMKHVAPIRRELGIPTIMNLLGPLTNPAGARRQVVGVADEHLLDLIGEALLELGHERALVVHGAPGIDELSPLGPTRVVELRHARLERYRLQPEEVLGKRTGDVSELAGGDPARNAHIIESILRGETTGLACAAVILNAAAALYVADQAESLEAGVKLAEAALAAGKAWTTLEQLREASHHAVAGIE